MEQIKGVPYGTKELPVFADADVVITGGGPGGLGAALMSARAGAKTILLEAYGLPGGMAAIGEVHPFMCSNAQGKVLDGPVYEEWRQTMRRYLPHGMMEKIANPNDYSLRSISKEAAALAAEDLLLGAGVKVLYHHRVVGVTMDGKRIRELVCETRGGFGAVRGRCFVDCTGDGEVAAMANCPFEMGDEAGGCQPMTLCFKLSHVKIRYCTEEPTNARLLDPEWRRELNARYAAAQKAGKIRCQRENVLIFPFQIADEGVLHFNTTRVLGYDATNGASFSEAEIEGRRQLRESLAWLRRDVPGFEECRLMSMAVQIGVRESRRIMGHYKLVKEDFLRCARFEDAVARCSYNIDIHSPRGAGTTLERISPGCFYDIPYRCVVPLGCDNLTVGGRPISADVAMHSSLRIMPTAVSIGQGAGLGAAWAALRGVSPAEISGEKLHRELIAMGAPLE